MGSGERIVDRSQVNKFSLPRKKMKPSPSLLRTVLIQNQNQNQLIKLEGPATVFRSKLCRHDWHQKELNWDFRVRGVGKGIKKNLIIRSFKKQIVK